MAGFHLQFSFDELRKLAALPEVVKREVNDAARNLSAMAHAKALEYARDRLRTRRQMFAENLSVHQESEDTWVITLNARAVWIDDGLPSNFDMLEGLLNSPKAKQGKKGRYVVIPFRHGPGQPVSPPQEDLVSTIKAEMKRRQIPWASIEKDASGAAKMGRLHSFSVSDKPLKTGTGPGQGWGPVGDVKQGPNARQRAGGGPGGGGTPFLQGVSVYQRPDATTKSGARRDVMTFRIASESQRGTGLWKHPGLQPSNIFRDIESWVAQTWERDVAPAVLERIRSATS